MFIIAGTYFTFTAGTIALLKMLRKNKTFYYKTTHFTAVSGLIYRMKQNAVGLSSIFVLATAVLVLVSTTFSLYKGVEDAVNGKMLRNGLVEVAASRDDLGQYSMDEIEQIWLCFVVEQILSNALKYTKNGGIYIYTKGYRLYISDNGIGIQKSDLPRIFEQGYTGYNGRADKKSTGIGLYLCRRVCEKLGHRISVESEIGKGTTVCLDLSYTELISE